MTKDLVTVSEAAKMLGVCNKTVRDWTNDGRLPCVRTLGGHRRIRTSVIEAALKGGSRHDHLSSSIDGEQTSPQPKGE